MTLLLLFVSIATGTGRTGTYILIDMVLNRMAKGEVWIQKVQDARFVKKCSKDSLTCCRV